MAPQRGRILIIDDEPPIVSAVRRTLREEHDVEGLFSAREALERVLGGATYDVILCDLMMPQMTGIDLHQELCRSAPHMAGKMVFMTGGAFTANAREFLEKESHTVVEKPFTPAALRALIRSRVAA
jgi:CheY-like chemotaxis protein